MRKVDLVVDCISSCHCRCAAGKFVLTVLLLCLTPLTQSITALTVTHLTAAIAMPFTAGWPLCGEGPA
jgi:hypothetical protein